MTEGGTEHTEGSQEAQPSQTTRRQQLEELAFQSLELSSEDRATAFAKLGEVDPDLAEDLHRLLAELQKVGLWSPGEDVEDHLED